MSAVDEPSVSRTFKEFFDSEKAGGFVLLGCTVLSLVLANSVGEPYVDLWHTELGGGSVEYWVNDGLMTVFFLLIGLELERELYVGELADRRRALLPILAAAGGALLPAGIHLVLNRGTSTQAGFGIPMATDIAFALGVLALLGNRVPASLKIFLVALAVIDDLLAILVIAVFYATDVSLVYLAAALGVFAALVALNRYRVMMLAPYLLGGLAMWYLMARSGVHPTITGVMLAFAIPFTGRDRDEDSPSRRLERALQKPVAFFVLPVFALANTALVLVGDALGSVLTRNGLGIVGGLLVGKPVGIAVSCLVAVRSGICQKPHDLGWGHVIGAGILGGIGFTMSIFITNLAFPGDASLIMSSKLAIFGGSFAAGLTGWVVLRQLGQTQPEKV